MVQKTAIALVLLVGCMFLLYGCTGSSNAPSQSGQNSTAAAAPSGNAAVTGVASTGAPVSNGTMGGQMQPATGMASLNESDMNVSASDNTGNAYTALPVDDGSDSPVNGS